MDRIVRNYKFRGFLEKFTKHPLLSGSLVMVVGTNLYNLGQFIYHFLTGRLLGRIDYGDLATIVSILGIISIVQFSLGLTIVKFIAGEKDKKSAANLAKWFLRISIWLGLGFTLLTFISTPYLASFLNIRQKSSLYLFSMVLFITFVLNTQRAILQATLSFNRYVLSFLTEVFVKIFLTIVFIYLGFAVLGGVAGFLLGLLCAALISAWVLRPFLRDGHPKQPEIKPLLAYSFPVFVQGLALTSFYSTDLLLVKHFLSASDAGIYASVAVLGRIIYFGSTPIINVMFPLIVKRFRHGAHYHNIFYFSFLMVLLISGLGVIFYKLFPSLPILILYGKDYLEGAPNLVLYGVFMLFLALATVFIQFYLSIGKTKTVWLFALAAIFQVILIWFKHPDITTVIKLSILCVALLTLSLFIYFPYHNQAKNE